MHDAIGESDAFSASNSDLQAINLRFPRQYDSESGLRYNYLRDYDPRLGGKWRSILLDWVVT